MELTSEASGRLSRLALSTAGPHGPQRSSATPPGGGPLSSRQPSKLTPAEETYTVEQAAEHAKGWCKRHGWQRICDIPNSDTLYYAWEELPKKERAHWLRLYGGYSAQRAWEEYGAKKCKVGSGFISGAGIFYANILDVPRFHNVMMVFKTKQGETHDDESKDESYGRAAPQRHV